MKSFDYFRSYSSARLRRIMKKGAKPARMKAYGILIERRKEKG